MALLLGCGLRRFEVLALQIADWDRRENTIRVIRKDGHERVIPVPEFVVGHLGVYVVGKQWGPVIRRQDGVTGVSNSYLGRLVSGWMLEAGIKQSPFDGRACHSLRHTLASEIADFEPDLRVLQEILGHQHLTSTQIYLRRAQLPKMRAAMEAVSAPG